MGRMILFVCGFVMVARGTAVGEETARSEPGTPGIAPRFLRVASVDERKGQIMLIEPTVRFISESGQTGGNGAARVMTKPVYETTSIGIVQLDAAEVFEAGGKKLGKEEVFKRVK